MRDIAKPYKNILIPFENLNNQLVQLSAMNITNLSNNSPKKIQRINHEAISLILDHCAFSTEIEPKFDSVGASENHLQFRNHFLQNFAFS